GRARTAQLPPIDAQLRLIEGSFLAATESADFLLDLPNILTEIAPRDRIAYLYQVVRALIERTGDPTLAIRAVTDRSTRHRIPRRDAQIVDGWIARGLVEVSDLADERLIELAELLAVPIISADRFLDHRRDHEWVSHPTSRLLRPTVRPDGTVELATHRPDPSASAASAVLPPAPSPHLGRLTRSYWECPDTTCTLYTPRHGTTRLPRLHQDMPTCEDHGLELRDAGPRPPATLLKVLADGVCVAQLTYQQGTGITIGRGAAADLDLAGLATSRGDMISRSHLVLTSPDGRLLVRSNGINGSGFRPADPTRRPSDTPRPWQYFRPPQERPFLPGDEIQLVTDVILRRSGPFFPAEIGAPTTSGLRD
ncbi:hypothetical protein, partial [Kitasatospora sp. NPDC002522]